MRKLTGVAMSVGLMLTSALAQGEDVFSTRNIGMDLARDIASEAVLACRKKGYQVAAVVVDRSATLRAALRDDLAARFTLQIADEKANAVIMSGTDTGTFARNREAIVPQLNEVDGIMILRGGVPIDAGGYRVGAIGVSGAPGGDIDEDCAKAALEKYAERLEFAE
ncbi:MAG TPA: heme-binding protein [Gammaproteobacteria bacterium]|nr:heme-binding protein [Gammaproteobacteria bacterium]